MQIRLSDIVFFSILLLGGSSFCAAIEVKYGNATKEGKTVALDTKFQKKDIPKFQKNSDREQTGKEFGTNIRLRTRRERGTVVIARQKRLKAEDIMKQEVNFLTDEAALNQEYMSMFHGISMLMSMSMSMPPPPKELSKIRKAGPKRQKSKGR